MGRIDPEEMEPIYESVHTWVRAVLELEGLPKAERKRKVRQIRRRLDNVVKKNRWMRGSPLAQRLYTEFNRRVRRLAPTFGTFLWSVARAIRPPWSG